MKPESNLMPILVQCAVIALLTFMILAATAALTSCRTCRQTQSAELIVAADSKDSLRDIRVRVDSVIVRDSTVTFIRGDTVFIDHWNRQRLVSMRVDTLVRVKYKTIYRTRTQTVTVTPRASPWTRIKEYLGMIAIGFILFKLTFWIINKLKNH